MDNETAMTLVRELRTATKAMCNATNAISLLLGVEMPLAKMPCEPQDAENELRKAEVTLPKSELPTLEKVRGVLAEKSRNGYTAEIRSLLEKHGATKLSDIDPVAYPVLLADAEVLGNG